MDNTQDMARAEPSDAGGRLPLHPGEADAVSREMAETYRRRVEFLRREYRKSLPEALALVDGSESGDAASLERARLSPPERVTSWDLRDLEEACPGGAAAKYEEVREWARLELTSGMRGAEAVENWDGMGGGPQERARYSALLGEMCKDWAPLTGIELVLVEQMAQAYTMQLYWTRLFGHYSVYRVGKVDAEAGRWERPRVEESQVVTDAAAMVDRWNRMFLRCLRQLRDLRRYAPVIVQNAGQVNVGGQQVNVSRQAGGRPPRTGKRRRRDRLTILAVPQGPDSVPG